jgi:predicted ATPase
MPYIRRIRISNYRSITDLDIDLTPPEGERLRHLILTGPNGSGKSSALTLIQEAFGKIMRPTGENSPLALDFGVAVSEVARQLASGGLLVFMFRAQRLLRLDETSGATALQLPRSNGRGEFESEGPYAALAAQLIVNRKTDQAFALTDGDLRTAEDIGRWFEAFEADLREVLEQPGLSLLFERKSYVVGLRYADGRQVTFQQLADGHSAALAIFLELFVRTELTAATAQAPREGIVIIDEIETHLHLRLQERILPFLTRRFPAFQFIVATHSPAVIASVPGAVVYDLARREAVPSEDFQGVRYGTLMTEHFGIVSDIDRDSTEKLTRLRALARAATRTDDEERELQQLAEVLEARSHTLALEVWKARNPSGGVA